MNPAFLGSWNLDKSRQTGVAEFSAALGVTKEQLSQMEKLDMTVTLSQEGSAYKFQMDFNGAVPGFNVVATPGKVCTWPHFDGSTSDMVLTVDGDKVIESYTDPKRGNYVTTRTMSGSEQKVVSKAANGATATFYLVRA